MAVEDRQEHTWLISVLFMDIVGYSKTSMADQKLMKDFLNQTTARAIESIAETDRVILDTGDGAAICFLSDPEMAVQAAVSIRKTLNNRPSYAPETIVRMGINLGPVRLVHDINGRMNAVGEGINIGQRVMAFAGDNQIAASRPYVEMVSCLGDDYKDLFVYVGMRTDKHSREHAIYMVQDNIGKNAGPSIILNAQAVEKIGVQLAKVVGPIAKVLVKRHQPGVTSYRMLVDKLATEIEDLKDRGRFLESIDELVRSHDEIVSTSKKGLSGAVENMRADYCALTVDAAVLSDAERMLAAYIGPVAKILTREVACKTSNSKELYEALAVYITDPISQRTFLDQLYKCDQSRKGN